MSYTINKSNGQTLIPGGLSDGSIDTTHSSLTLIGRNYAGYGSFLNENFVYLLENFSNSTSPNNALVGQLWWDSTNALLKVWTGTSWKINTGSTSSGTAPTDIHAGDLWFDSTNQQLKVFSGTQWVTVGPAASAATGNTGAFPALMTDLSSGTHVVIQFLIGNTVYAIFSKDTFSSALSGFATIKAGLNFSTIASPSWVLSTQDVNPTASTLVQRDGSGGINALSAAITGALTAASVTAGTITATSGFTGNLTGNVSAITVNANNVINSDNNNFFIY